MLSWEFLAQVWEIYEKESGSENGDTNDVINSCWACNQKKLREKNLRFDAFC